VFCEILRQRNHYQSCILIINTKTTILGCGGAEICRENTKRILDIQILQKKKSNVEEKHKVNLEVKTEKKKQENSMQEK
jgi:hypothetical protein